MTEHTHADTCKLTTIEDGRVVVYRGRRAVLDWLNRVADLARERSGEGVMNRGFMPSPVRAPTLSDAHLSHSRLEEPPASDPTRDDPAATST